MQRQLISIAVAASIVLAATIEVRALPPRQHSVAGVIETVDWAGRRISQKPAAGAPALALVWNDRTRSTKDAGCAQGRLAVGRTIRAHYRQEVGQNVLRAVSSSASGCNQGQP